MINCEYCQGAQYAYDETGDNLIDCIWCEGKGRMNTLELVEYSKAYSPTKNKKGIINHARFTLPRNAIKRVP